MSTTRRPAASSLLGSRSLTGLLGLCLGLFLSACTTDGNSPTSPVGADEDYQLIPDGKEDNFRGSNAQEFSATATATVVLGDDVASASSEERLAKATELVSARLLQIGWFLNLYVADKEHEDANLGYGGFHAMARNSSVKSLEIVPPADDATGTDALTYSFNFEATIAGQNGFLGVLPGKQNADGSKQIDLKLGKVSNESLLKGGWQTSYDVHAWDPRKLSDSEVETLSVKVAAAPRSSNAYLNYPALYDDGKLTVGAQFGWDYNAGRADLANARQFYDDLIRIGFTSPVEQYEDLKIGSGPLTRASTVNGKQVQVEVTIIHPGMVESASANAVDLRNALLDLLATRKVILFNAHAGVSGRLLPADFRSTSAGNIMPTEYPTLKLLPTYQLFLIEGCQTYARFTDGFRQNPLKRGPNGELVNMDIVTSTSYTWTSQGAESMQAILYPLIGESATKNVKPVTWDDVLRTLNAPPNNTAFMGVNGIDNDPHAHPYGRVENLGKSCYNLTQCGGEGNLCVRTGQVSTSPKVCATVCIDDAGCPSDHRRARIARSGQVAANACIKR